MLQVERNVEKAAWVDGAEREDWRIHVVCVSPSSQNRGNLTLSCVREVYTDFPSVVNSIEVVHDERDADRKIYAPSFLFHTIPRPARSDTKWAEEPWDSVCAIGGMSDEQGASLKRVIAERHCRFGINGTPGFNIGFSEKAAELTRWLQDRASQANKASPPQAAQGLVRGQGIVEDASVALVVNLEEHATYLGLLPRTAQLAAKQSRVAFPLTARGRTSDGAGSYGRQASTAETPLRHTPLRDTGSTGPPDALALALPNPSFAHTRQFRDAEERPTTRERGWFIRLAEAYARELGKSHPESAQRLAELADALLHADLSAMAEAGEVKGDKDELGALLQVCDEFVRPEVVAAMHASAERLFHILIKCDAEVGVVQSKIYDAKRVLPMAAAGAGWSALPSPPAVVGDRLALSMAVQLAVEAGLPAGYGEFGLGEPDERGMSAVCDRPLVRDLVFTLMSLHKDKDKGRYVPQDEELRRRVDAALNCLQRLPVRMRQLMICDTGVDPNEDDLVAIMMVANINLLCEGKLDAGCGSGGAGGPRPGPVPAVRQRFQSGRIYESKG